MRLIFHIPLKIDRNDPSASQIRPQKLMAAFTELGWEMDVVEGRGSERKRQIAAIKRKIRQGVHYDFCYSESSTMPTLLTEPHHLPTYPCLDFGFLAFCKRHGIPVGLFYRDIFWQFEKKDISFKQIVARWFYQYDLRQYGHIVDVLFLPTIVMREYIPHVFTCKMFELPSGYQGDSNDWGEEREDGRENREELNLFYVGGVGGSYNMLPLIEAVRDMNGIRLRFCCRTYDWDLVRDEYEPLLTHNIEIIHKGGRELEMEYRRADIFVMTMSTKYERFSAPYKLFESIGHHVPLLVAAGTWSGDFVERNGVGLTCPNEVDALKQTLRYLRDHRDRLQALRSNISIVAKHNTWSARCQQIASALLNKDVQVYNGIHTI